MIVGVGVDVVRIGRMERRLAERVLTDLEMEEFRGNLEYLAGRFALKEAFFKALGTGLSGYSFKDVSFVRGNKGEPRLVLHRDFEVVFNFAHVSLSHDFVAVALVVLEKRKGGITVRGEVEGFEIVSRDGDVLEIDSPFGPFKTKEMIEKQGAELMRYGNILIE